VALLITWKLLRIRKIYANIRAMSSRTGSMIGISLTADADSPLGQDLAAADGDQHEEDAPD
jgi:hypothetical protein